MVVSDILDQLKYGELHHLKIGDLASEDERKVVIGAINLGLIELHKRFYLISKQLVLNTQEDVYEYLLSRVLAASNNLDPYPHNYLDSSFNQIYNNDLLKVERIFNDDNEELPLNDDNEESSFFTPQYNIIRVPLDYPPKTAIVEYRAAPEKISSDEDCEGREIPLPPALIEPLLLFVGFRVSRILNTDQGQETGNYFQLFENSCQRITDMGYQIVFRHTNDKLDQRGWV